MCSGIVGQILLLLRLHTKHRHYTKEGTLTTITTASSSKNDDDDKERKRRKFYKTTQTHTQTEKINDDKILKNAIKRANDTIMGKNAVIQRMEKIYIIQ